MIIGIPLVKGFMDDGRCIYYLKEDIRRMFQRTGFSIKVFIPGNYKKEDLNMINGLYLPDGEYDKSILVDARELNVPIYGEDNFLDNCKNRKIEFKKKNKVVGVVSRYLVIDEASIVYLSDRLRKTLLLAGANIDLIIPIQDVDYPTTRGNEFLELTNEDKKLIDNKFMEIDGLLLPGGFKFTPYDRYLLEEAINKDIPTLGICLGMQTMSCYKDVIDLRDIDSYINHKQENDDDLTHSVVINKNSLLYKIIGSEKIMVNSFHKKMITPNTHLNSVAFSYDNIIEGIEMPDKKFVLGLQWHPEISYEFDNNSKKIIDYYINLL